MSTAALPNWGRGVAAVSSRGPLLFRLHCAPSFAAQWLGPRLPGLLQTHPSLEIRLAAGTDYSRFAADEFDADIIYGLPRQAGLNVLPLGEEVVTPLCVPALAAKLTRAADLLAAPLLESDNKTLRWSDWFSANALAPPQARRARFDRSFLAIAAAVSGLGVALESTLLAERGVGERSAGAPVARAGGGLPLCRAPAGVPARCPAPATDLVRGVAGGGTGPDSTRRRWLAGPSRREGGHEDGGCAVGRRPAPETPCRTGG